MSNQRNHNSRLEAVVSHAVDAIITIDERGIMDSVNPAAERLFGYTRQELLGRNVRMLMPPPYEQEHDGYLRDYVAGGAPTIIGIGREVEGQRKDGSRFPIHVAVSEFFDGGQRMFAGIVRDISDLKQVERQLKQLNEDLEARVRERTAELHKAQAELVAKEKLATLGQVSGGIAHEIRNPLNAVKTSVYYLVHARNPSKEKTLEHLDRIDRQVTLIDNVVTALTDVAKLPDPNRRPLDVERILREVIRSTVTSSDVEIKWDLQDLLPRVLADQHQLPIVFQNLVRNAHDAMPQGGIMTIRASIERSKLHISVVDTGHGIAPEQLNKVVEPLYSTKARGMGLGLAICKTIVEKNGGELRIASQVGKGSTFSVILTVAE